MDGDQVKSYKIKKAKYSKEVFNEIFREGLDCHTEQHVYSLPTENPNKLVNILLLLVQILLK